MLNSRSRCRKFWKVGVVAGVGHFTSDSATLLATPASRCLAPTLSMA